jgi:hypothetical protein
MTKGWIKDWGDWPELSDAQVFALISSNVKSTSLAETYHYLSKVPFVDQDDKESCWYMERLSERSGSTWGVLELRRVMHLAWDYLDRFCNMAKLLCSEASDECIPTLFKSKEQDGMFNLFVRHMPCGEQLFEEVSRSNRTLFAQPTLLKAGECFLSASESHIFGASRRDHL